MKHTHTHIWSSAHRCCSFDLNRTCGAWPVACDAGTACLILFFLNFSNHHGNNHVHIYVYIYTHHVVGSCLFATECRHVLIGSSAQVCIHLRFTVSLTQPMGEIEVPPHLGVTANELMTSQVLFLKSRQITDLDSAIAPCLKQNASLRQLFIGYNEFGDEGARHLCEALAAVEGVT